MFAVSTRVKYGMKALAHLAIKRTDKPINIGAISDREKISRKYLENIFKLLKKNKIIRSIRGPEGGYQLFIDPGDLTIFQIVEALDGPLETLDCVVVPGSCCGLSTDCSTRNFWTGFQNHLETYLKSKTLLEVINDTITEGRNDD